MVCIYYCANCKVAASQDNGIQCPDCPDCKNRMFETLFPKTKWDELSQDEKAAKKQNWQQVIDHLSSIQANETVDSLIQINPIEEEQKESDNTRRLPLLAAQQKTNISTMRRNSTFENGLDKEVSFCNKCGNRLIPNSRFCNKCGAPITKL